MLRKPTRLLALTLAVASPAAAQPRFEEDFAATRAVTGAFAGARLRLRLGPGRGERGPFAVELGAAPMATAFSPSGERRMRMGEGMMLSFAARGAPQLKVGGRNLAEAAGHAPQGRRLGIGKTVWIVGGAVVAAVVGFLLYADAINDRSD